MRKPAQYVYVAKVGEWAKVGIARDVKARAKQLFYHHKMDVEVVRVWRVGAKALDVETLCIREMWDRRAAYGREFFMVPVEELAARVSEIVRCVRSGAVRGRRVSIHAGAEAQEVEER